MTHRTRTILALTLALAMAATAVSCRKGRRLRPVRTVALRMSGYAFNETNPILTFRTGERVRFVLTNDETTMIRHNLRVAELGVPCDYELGPGESRVVIVTMPDRPGVFAYDCCTHRGMGGTLVVTDR